MKKILMTGATGFIGSKLIEHLKREYDSEDIVILASDCVDGIDTVLHADYSYNKEALMNLEDNYSLFHFGATTPKNLSDYYSIKKYANNIRTTQYLLENLPKPPSQIIFASTIDVYDRIANSIIDEQSSIQTTYAYGLSKYYSEMLVREYCENNHVSCKIMRIGNIYGPGEFEYSKIVGFLIKQCLSGDDIVLHGGGKIRRNLFFIDDLCKAVVDISRLHKNNITINLCSQYNVSLNELSEEVKRVTESSSKIIVDNGAGRDDVFDSKFRMELLPELIETKLPEGIKKTMDSLY